MSERNGEPQVAVILGSKTDFPKMKDMFRFFGKVGVSYEACVISAHRNPEKLQEYCLDRFEKGVGVFVGAAGMNAALPGAIASILGSIPVIGVPLVSEVCGGQDALLAMLRMPPGIPVAVPGFGDKVAYQAAILVCQILGLTENRIHQNLNCVLATELKKKEPQVPIPQDEIHKLLEEVK